ncbi:MAG: hypothetical protein PHG16_01930 [Lachnospiraceae bacterium]|nr:hypothetical protein [Lachnospiraceae bacterium]
MAQAQQQINLLHTLFTVCLVIFIIGMLTTIALFFFLDIRKIFGVKTGRSVRKAIQQMEEENAKTGRLLRTQPSGLSGDITSEKLRKSGKIKKNHTSRDLSRPVTASPSESVDHNAVIVQQEEGTENTTVLQEIHDGSEGTSVLTDSQPAVSADRSVETDKGGRASWNQNTDQSFGKFIIERSVMLIHTDEVV